MIVPAKIKMGKGNFGKVVILNSMSTLPKPKIPYKKLGKKDPPLNVQFVFKNDQVDPK